MWRNTQIKYICQKTVGLGVNEIAEKILDFNNNCDITFSECIGNCCVTRAQINGVTPPLNVNQQFAHPAKIYTEPISLITVGTTPTTICGPCYNTVTSMNISIHGKRKTLMYMEITVCYTHMVEIAAITLARLANEYDKLQTQIDSLNAKLQVDIDNQNNTRLNALIRPNEEQYKQNVLDMFYNDKINQLKKEAENLLLIKFQCAQIENIIRSRCSA